MTNIQVYIYIYSDNVNILKIKFEGTVFEIHLIQDVLFLSSHLCSVAEVRKDTEMGLLNLSLAPLSLDDLVFRV